MHTIMLQFKKKAVHARKVISCRYQQAASLVNVKMRWVKDKELDDVVAREKDLKIVCNLKDRICGSSKSCLPIWELSDCRRKLGLNVRVSTFMRRYPTIFEEFTIGNASGSVPWFRLTGEAMLLHQEECRHLHEHGPQLVESLSKLLMLSKDMMLPLQTIDQLRWDMGLENKDYAHFCPHLFQRICLEDGREALKLLCWDDHLAVSGLVRYSSSSLSGGVCSTASAALPFPVKFTRGFGLKKKCMSWLREWQTLPYTSPYADPSHLDRRTDASEKRIVGVFHELLHLTVQGKTERRNVSNLREPFQLPQKFTKVFGRHPGIFYISRKGGIETVILREAYDGCNLVQKHPLAELRNKYVQLMRLGFLNRSRGLYKKDVEIKIGKLQSSQGYLV
ncbi:unnamed protein product [Victoria cruziana]